jgi:hypothetical protein
MPHSSISFHLAITLAANMRLSPFYALLMGSVVLAQCMKLHGPRNYSTLTASSWLSRTSCRLLYDIRTFHRKSRISKCPCTVNISESELQKHTCFLYRFMPFLISSTRVVALSCLHHLNLYQFHQDPITLADRILASTLWCSLGPQDREWHKSLQVPLIFPRVKNN